MAKALGHSSVMPVRRYREDADALRVLCSTKRQDVDVLVYNILVSKFEEAMRKGVKG